MTPGEYLLAKDPIPYNEGRPTRTLAVTNSGDRPIQVGSHYHFYETNSALLFDRPLTLGYRLNIPAGTALRFEPGQTRSIELVALPKGSCIYGFQAQVMGPLPEDSSCP
jgi:urease subunit beta